jgi:putative beta-barrel porin BBP2
MKISTAALRIALGLTLGLSSARPVAAQSQGAEEARTQARIHVGPLYLTPGVQLREIGVDTNVFNTNADPKSDFTFTVGPEANAWIPFGRRALLKTSGGADLVYFQTYSSERSINPRAEVRGEVYLHRVTLFGENEVLNTRQRPNYEIDVRARRLENTLRAGGQLRLSSKFAVEVAARQSIVRFDGDALFAGSYLEEVLNRDSRGVSATFRYRRTPLTTIVVRTEKSRDTFTASPVRDADTLRIEPGVEFRPPALIAGSGYLGVRRLDPLHKELPAFSGMVGSGRLRFRLPGATTIEFSGDRDLSYSYERLQPYYIVDGYGATVRRQIVRRFDASVSAQRQGYSYRDLLVPDRVTSRPGAGREDTTVIYSMSVGYIPKRDSRVGVVVSKMSRDSNAYQYAVYEGFRVGTTVTYGF